MSESTTIYKCEVEEISQLALVVLQLLKHTCARIHDPSKACAQILNYNLHFKSHDPLLDRVVRAPSSLRPSFTTSTVLASSLYIPA